MDQPQRLFYEFCHAHLIGDPHGTHLTMNNQQWYDLMARLGLSHSLETFNALVAAHSGSTRHYHNVAHIAHCLGLVDKFRGQIPEADLVELAFWFHDAVYNAQSKTNEEDSADWAVQFLSEAGAPEAMSSTVHALIMATKHAVTELTPSQEWLVDIDLSILGTESTVFERYEENIRLEYEWVPREEFNQKRAALLEGFLARTWIFNTAFFRGQYEEKARRNLRWSIERLIDQ